MTSILQLWKNSRNKKNPLKFILSKILMRLNISHYFIINQNGYRLYFFPTELSRVLWVDPNESHTATIFFADYLKKNDIIVDIGANIGTITLQSSIKIGSRGKVYSIEPNPKIFNFLLKNIQLNKLSNIETFNVALGDSEGEINFSDNTSDVVNLVLSTNEGIKTKITTLDKLIPQDTTIDLLKIDVIGYEKFVLIGSKNILKNTKCIHFPVIRKQFQNFGYDCQEIFDLLKNNGFELYGFSKEKKIWKINQNYTSSNEDLLAIRNIEEFIEKTGYFLIDEN
jgi:FkbM family methyltransferase